MKKKYQIALVTIGCLIALIGLSYAYFVATSKGGGPGGSATVNTVTIDEVGFSIEGELEFEDLDILPGHKNVSKIKATAIGKDDIINYKLVWEGINTLNTPLKYYVYKTIESENPSITCNKETEIQGTSKIYYETCNENNFDNLGSIITSGEITKTETSTEFVLANEEVIKGTKEGNIVNYYVVLEYPNLNESQNIDMGGSFDGMLTVKKEEDNLVDLNIKKIYQETDAGYQEINRMPDNGYTINTEKSTCTNNATPTYRNNKILITNLTTSNTECEIYFDKDKEKPVITNLTTSVTETEISVTVEATDNVGVAEYYYKIDEEEYVKGTGNTYTFTGLESKTTHTITAYVKDASGNESEISSITATTVDVTKPTITGVTASTTMTEIEVTVEASDNVAVAEYYYSIDNGEFIQGTGNTYRFTDLGINTSHTISAYVKDTSGNQSETSTNTFNTEPDSEDPAISNVTINATETEISVTVEATDNVGVTEYYYQIDNNEPVKQIANTYTFTGLSASTSHVINVYVKDNAGNESETRVESVTTPDITKPTISNITTSGTETEITVIVEASDNVGVTEYYFAMNNGTFNKVTTNTFKFTGLTAGVTHNIKVYVKDAAGNQSETTTKSVTTPDTTNPIVDNITTSVTETEINVTVSATDNTEVAEYWYAIDNGTFTKGTGNTYKFTGLAAKSTHTVKVYVKDKFGNQSETLTASATTIDSTKPTISKVDSSVTMTEISVTVTATDNVGVTEYWYKIDSGSFIKGTGNTYKFTGLGINTSHTISVYVKDASGNQSDTSTSVITTAADTAKPTISDVTTSVTKTEISVIVTATDNVGVTEYWYQLDSNAAVKQTTNTYQFTGLAAGSTHTINVYVKDAAGNQSTTTTKSVTTEAPTASETILDNITVKTTTPNFANVATTNEGVFKVADGMYGGYSYYWRGTVTNNYVKFSGFCWRIVRINGDGTIRLIYDGTTCHANGTDDPNSIARNGIVYNVNKNYSAYVGWTYTVGSQRPSDNTTATASYAKTELESWYSSNITGTSASKVASGKYCNDRNVGSGSYSNAGTTFYYAGYTRLYTNKTPTLSCPTSDVYTISVGLITADEVAYAGGVYGTTNRSYYLYNGQNYWTMSPNYWNGNSSHAGVFYVSSGGDFGNYGVLGTLGLRPVINLKADTTFSSGDGTQSNPYVVQ